MVNLMLNEIKRILIVGSGSIGQRHLSIARRLFPSANICVYSHKINDRVSLYANSHVYDKSSALGFGADLAVICNPAPFHLEIASALANMGVHILVEKPLSNSLRGVEDFSLLAKKNNIVVSVGYNLRFLPSLQYFRKVIQDSIIGNLLSVRCECGQFLPLWRPNTDYKIGVSSRAELGGGVLNELSHEIDYLMWIFGQVQWVNATLQKNSDLEIDVEDTAYILLGLEKQNEQNALVCSISLDFIRQDHTRYCIAIGNKGTLKWDALSSEIHLWDLENPEGRLIYSDEFSIKDTYEEEWLNFINAIENNTSVMSPLADGAECIKVLELVRKSSSEERKVSLREFETNGSQVDK